MMDHNYVKIPQRIARSKDFKYIGMYAYLKSYVNLDQKHDFIKRGMLVAWPGYSQIRRELWGVKGNRLLGSTHTVKAHLDELVKLGWIRIISETLKNGKTKHYYHLGNVIKGKQVYFIDEDKDVAETETSDGAESATSQDGIKIATSSKDRAESATSLEKDGAETATSMAQKLLPSIDQYSKDQDQSIYLYAENSEDRVLQNPKKGIIVKRQPINKPGPKSSDSELEKNFPEYGGIIPGSRHKNRSAEPLFPSHSQCNAAPRQPEHKEMTEEELDRWAILD